MEVLADRLHAAALRLSRRHARDDRPLSPPRRSALSTVALAGPVGVGALASTEGVSAPTMSRLIDALERDGLVRRIPDRADARGVLVSITAAGRAALRERHRAPALARDLAALSEDERAVVARAAELIERLGRTGG